MKKYIIVFFLISLLNSLVAAEKTCVSGDCKNGAGTAIYTDGNLYIGEFKRGKKHGKGVMLYNDGTKFEGQWLNDQISYVDPNDKPTKKKLKRVAAKKRTKVVPGRKKREAKKSKVSEMPAVNNYGIFSKKLSKSYEETMLKYHENQKKKYTYEMNEMDWKKMFSKVIFIVMSIAFLFGLILSGYFFYISIKNYNLSFNEEVTTAKKTSNKGQWQKDMLLFFYGISLFIGTLTLYYLYLANIFIY